MSQQGIFSWSLYKKEFPVVLAGREISTDMDSLRNSFEFVNPVVTAGVRTAQGFVHQSTTPSPQAPGASRPFAFTLFPDPQLDQDTHRHYEAVYACAEYDPLPKIWFPFPFVVAWGIIAGRSRYSTPFFISGSAGEASIGQPRFFEPIVEIRQGGIFVEALTFNAGAPSSTEFSLDSIVTDTRAILVGDLAAHVGKQLVAWIYCLIEVVPQGLTGHFARPGEWRDELPLISAPSPFDYEGDT